MNVAEAIEAKRATIAVQKEELAALLKKQGEDFFKDGLAPFWDAYPEVQTIHWLQYTPYFNDGEECVFGVGTVYFSKTPFEEIEETYGEDDEGCIELTVYRNPSARDYTRIPAPGVTEQMVTDFNAVSSMIHELDLQTLFGDHQWVKVHRGGVELQDYDHE